MLQAGKLNGEAVFAQRTTWPCVWPSQISVPTGGLVLLATAAPESDKLMMRQVTRVPSGSTISVQGLRGIMRACSRYCGKPEKVTTREQS